MFGAELSEDDQATLATNAEAKAAELAGATVVAQARYHFGHNSPPGFTAVVLLDESHCSAHSYADLGLIALDIFTCGGTNPLDVLGYLQQEVDLGDVSIRQVGRFADDGFAAVDDKLSRALTVA